MLEFSHIIINSGFRIREMNQKYPLMNPGAEDACEFSKKYNEAMKSSATTWNGCKVDSMKDYISDDICIILDEKPLPGITTCRHDGFKR